MEFLDYRYDPEFNRYEVIFTDGEQKLLGMYLTERELQNSGYNSLKAYATFLINKKLKGKYDDSWI